jgi:hypothetical protein
VTQDIHHKNFPRQALYWNSRIFWNHIELL